MARDSSPLSKRLKALAVRAGLPVEAEQAPPAASAPAPVPTDDEQPTGEFPAVASDASEDDQPTGEFPAVAAPEAAEAPVGAVPPPLRDDPPATTIDEVAPVDEAPRPTVPPIWTDSPAESQSPLTAGPADGPTLSPPTLTSLDKPSDAEPPTTIDSSDAADAEPATQLHEVGIAPDDLPTGPDAEAEVAEPTSRAAQLDEALSLGPADATAAPTDGATDAEATPSANSDAVADSEADEQETIDAASVVDEAEASVEQTSTDAAERAAPSLTKDEEAPAAEEPPADPQPTPTDKLSLTGKIAALRKRVRPDSPPAAPVAAIGTGAAAADAAPEPAIEAEPPAPVAVVEPTPNVPASPADEPLAKPSFSERAALRRRVKSLRARRDAGLLELGAITIDQRRFGDPTAGSLLRKRTDELVDLDNEIAAIEHALDKDASATAVAALATVRCLGCGSLVGPADRYCAHCGTPRPTDAAAPPDRDS